MTETALSGLGDVGERQIWLRAFYGFDPEGAGYIGFTHARDRQKMLDEMRDGDLVLIYGAVEELTDRNLRAQALGFLEVTDDPCDDRSRMSAESYQWKLERGFENRWTHGIRVRRAWRVRNRVAVRNIAPEAYKSEHRFERTTKAIKLDDIERARALTHTVYQVNVFGETRIADENLSQGPLEKIWTPSSGPPPSFGARTSTHEDGETVVYLMAFDGPAAAILGKRQSEELFKVGRSSDPKRRLVELNCGFPPSSPIKWKMLRAERFADARTAHSVETVLKARMAETHRSEGGEFFTGARRQIEKSFSDTCTEQMHIIRGAAAKALGV